MAKIPVPGARGLRYALVDAADEDLLNYAWRMAGGKAPKGQINHGKYAATYATVAGKQRTIFLHRVIAARMGLVPDPFTVLPTHGPGQWEYSVDHANGDKLDNRRENLRLRDRRQQMTNGNDGLRVTNASGVRGVSYAKSRERFGKPWKAAITENGRSINLGWFATLEEAAEARRSYDAATDKAAWLAGRRPRAVGSSGYRGVQAFPDGRFYAKAWENGQTIPLGGYDSAEDAAKARESYLAAQDKEAWLAQLRAKPQSNGSSGHRGVSLLKKVRERQWQAYANKAGIRINLGRYDTAEDAAAARRAWEERQASASA